MKLEISILATTSLALTLAAAPFHLGFLALVAMMPLLVLHERPWRQRFLMGWATGFAFQVMASYWIFFTVRDFGGVSSGLSLLAAVLFWAYQGMDFAVWLWIFPALARGRLAAMRPLSAAACWLLLQAHIFPYVFPWSYGADFIEPAFLASGAALWGDHGLAFLAILMQAAWITGGKQGRSLPRLLLFFVLPALLYLAGALNHQPLLQSQTWRVAVVQPNIIPWAKRKRPSFQDVFFKHYEMSMKLAQQKVDLILWPETAVPFPLNEANYYENKIRELVQATGAALITGAIERQDDRYYNAVFLYTPEGAPAAIYRKERLVLFGERMPWYFGWINQIIPNIGGLTGGSNNEVFHYRGKDIIPLVCYEALFSNYVHQYRGQLIVNLTNDAWFGESKASILHLQQIRMRALENHIPMVRATNSGISCWVDTKGKVHGSTQLYQATTPIYEIPIPDSIPKRMSPQGSSFLQVVSLITVLVGLIATSKRKQKGLSK